MRTDRVIPSRKYPQLDILWCSGLMGSFLADWGLILFSRNGRFNSTTLA